MNPSNLRYPITIHRPTGAVDQSGQPTGATVLVFSGRCAIRDLATRDTREENRNEKRRYLEGKAFTIRRCGSYEPRPDDVIFYNSKQYDIYQIIDPSTVAVTERHGMYWRLSAEART